LAPRGAAAAEQRGHGSGIKGNCDVNKALAPIPPECFGGPVAIPPLPKAPEEDDMLMFWYLNALYLMSGGRRSPAGLSPRLADELTAAGVQRIGKPADPSPLFDMLPPFKG
jgi:hypothetical protein